ncbi:pou domain protein [Caudoviricetes sp.]|nr:pou domain protein [Caudoviricetes sp.]
MTTTLAETVAINFKRRRQRAGLTQAEAAGGARIGKP